MIEKDEVVQGNEYKYTYFNRTATAEADLNTTYNDPIYVFEGDGITRWLKAPGQRKLSARECADNRPSQMGRVCLATTT